jgi:citrate synthase
MINEPTQVTTTFPTTFQFSVAVFASPRLWGVLSHVTAQELHATFERPEAKYPVQLPTEHIGRCSI